MKPYITFDGRSVTKSLTKFARLLPKYTDRGLELFTNKLASEIRKEAKARKHNATGYLSSKRGTHSARTSKNSWGVKMPYYTRFLEKGTSEHIIPRMRKTELWASQHGMSFASMRRRIAARGTKAHPFTASVIKREVKKELGKTLKKQLKNVFTAR